MPKVNIYTPATIKVVGNSLVSGSGNIYVRLAHTPVADVRPVSRPFLEGMGSIINLSGKYRVFDKYTRGSAVLDMRHDWEIVGSYLREAMDDFKMDK